ncbi:MAG TPA: trehalose-6-phosphate synthase [Candidatus Dormibacteraeota bacterium]|nr:trehalose-6-phosphate synthase [Candidatus Dormibacteraeota bacterium]
MKPTAQTPALQEIARESSRLLSQFSPIVLSNRAPIEPMPDGRHMPGAGGLVKALTSLATAVKASWVAAARTQWERELAARGASIGSDEGSDDSFPISFAPTDEEAYALHYAVVSNPLLWFAHHYLWNIATEPVVDKAIYRAWFEGYCKINASVADHAVSVARALPNRPLFLTQDYQLYLAPEAIRAALPEAVMQQFIHVPWPEPRYFKVLPAAMREPIFRGLLANDIVGLQTSLDVHNFLRCCAELMGLRVVEPDSVVLYGGRLVWVRAYPVSIDVDALKQLGESETVTDISADVESWRPQKLIVRVDRTDPAKNLVRGFLAYERLLEDHPEHHGRVGMWAFLQPSRQDVDAYRQYLELVRATVDRINARFGGDGWQPTRLDLGEDINRAVAAYRSYDVLLVNPILDGMNLVAKEGPIVNQRAGVLILSESAGAHEELGAHALSINPFDVEVTARALHRALQMSQAERSERSIAINQVVAANDVARWIRHQLEDIRSLAPPQRSHSHAEAVISIPE